MQPSLRLASALALSLLALPAPAEDAPRLTVAGTGRLSLPPDLAVLTAGVRAEAREADDAIETLAEGLVEVRQALTDLGIPDDAVQTQSQTLRPVYSRYTGSPTPPQRIEGYVAQSTFSVELEDLQTVGAVLEEVVEAGANVVQGLSFELSDPDAARIAAQQEAVANARIAAEALAASAGVVLGPVFSVVADTSPIQPLGIARFEAASESVPVSPGAIEVTATVQMSFDLIR